MESNGVRLEMVVGAGMVDVYLTDHEDRPIKTENRKGRAILLISGKKAEAVLRPAGHNRLSGTAPVTRLQPITAIITVEGDGARLSARFVPAKN